MQQYSYKIRLRELVVSQKGTKPAVLEAKKFNESVPYLDVKALETGSPAQYTIKELGTEVTDKDVLIVWDGSRCGMPFIGEQGVAGSTIMVLTPISIIPEYLRLFIYSKYDLINKNPAGTGIPHVDPNLFYELEIPVISIDDQHKAILEIEQLKEENKNLLSTQQKELFKSLNVDKSINFDVNGVQEMIERLKSEFLRHAIITQVSSDDNNQIEDGLAKTEYRRLEQVTSLITSGERDWSRYYSESGSRFIRTQDIKNNTISKERMIFVQLPEKNQSSRTMVEIGNVLLTIVGSNIGKCAIVTEDFGETGYVNQAIALIKPNSDINPKFLYYFLQSPLAQDQIQNKIYGDAQPDLNLKDVRDIELPYPTLSEQDLIVERIEKVMPILEEIALDYIKILDDTDALEKSLLQHIFNKPEIIATEQGKTKDEILETISNGKEKIISDRKLKIRQKTSIRRKIMKEIPQKQPLLEIISTYVEISAEDLWKKSTHFESRDIESFYEELFNLQVENKISTKFSDEEKTQSIIAILDHAN